MLREEIKAISSTRRDLRNFGLVVGGGFLIFGGLLFWREKTLWPYFGGAGLGLALLGLAAPPVLKPLQKIWMKLAVVMGWFMTRLILSVLFYLVLTPIALGGRLFGKGFLDRTTGGQKSYWIRRQSGGNDREQMEKQF